MRIAIGGDVSVKETCRELFAKRQVKELFNDVPSAYEGCDRVIVNLECCVTDRGVKIEKFGPHLDAPHGTLEVLKASGVTDCALSNNHIFDLGIDGLKDTIADLERNGMGYTGVGENDTDARKNMILTDGKTKVAVINVCEHEYSYALPNRIGAREYDPYDTNDDIVEAKKSADHVIVIYHGGKEHCRYPSPRLMKLCRSMVKHGASAVLCQHSHCIGCYEEYEGGHILYGQGNFHFVYEPYSNGDDPEKWNTGLIVRLELTDKCKIEFIPTVVRGKGIALAKGELKERLLAELEARSQTIKDGTWIEHWREFCQSVRERYTVQANPECTDLFAHYLDCEAHTDVWRELYKTWNHTNEIY